MDDENTTGRQDAIKALREFADWLEAHPEARFKPIMNFTVLHGVSDVEEMAELRRSLGGLWEKDATEISFDLTRKWGELVKYTLHVPRREVCTAREVTRKQVIRERDPEAVEKALAAIPEVEREVEVTETVWECDESLLAGVES